MPRIFRNRIAKNLPPLSLRLNTNFDKAIELLRAHHGSECWVDDNCEAVWRLQSKTNPPKLFIFELYLGENMVAADFGHLTTSGTSFYVATRAYDSNNNDSKQLQCGFLLALAQCEFLRKNGCHYWDLGGVDLTPLYAYKWDLVGNPISRSKHLQEFRESRKQAAPNTSAFQSNSILIDDINITHLLV